MNSFQSDFKVGWRQVVREPGNMLLAVAAYAIGLGLVGLMLTLHFGVVRVHPKGLNFESIQVLGWDDSTRHLWTNGAQTRSLRIRDLEQEQEPFAHVAAMRAATLNIVVDPDETPLGKQIRDVSVDSHPWFTVAGVVPDTKMAGPGPRDESERAGANCPMSASPQSSVTVFSRSAGNALAQSRAIQSVLRELDNSIALYRVKTVDQAIEDSNFASFFFRNMFGLFGIAALALASIGVYGVMAFSVRQRFREFGIRQAVGASKSTLIRFILRSGVIQTALGILIGVGLGWAILAAIGQDIGNLQTRPIHYLLPILVLTSIALLALYLPARYVTNLNLGKCLREE